MCLTGILYEYLFLSKKKTRLDLGKCFGWGFFSDTSCMYNVVGNVVCLLYVEDVIRKSIVSYHRLVINNFDDELNKLC